MANYKEKKTTHTGAAGYEYTPGDGSAAEKKDQERQSQKRYTTSKTEATSNNKLSSYSANRNTRASNVSPTVSGGASALAAAANTMASRGTGSGGGYGNGQTVKVGSDGKAPKGLSVGTDVVTGGGTYRIMGVNADGTYQSQKINNVNTGTYSGVYDNAPYGGAQGLDLWDSGGINGSDGQGGFAMYGTGYFQDAEGTKYPELLYTLQPDGTIKNNLNGQIVTYYPGDDRAGKTSVFNTAIKAYGPSGQMIMLSSAEERDFAANARAGETKKMNGATYTKNADGGVTVQTDDGKIFSTALDDGSWTGTDGTGRSGPSGHSGSGGGSGGFSGTGPIGLTGGSPQQTAPAWQMPATQGVQAFNFTPYEDTALGQQSAAEYQALLDKIKNYPEFSYDPSTDPTYQQYADAYSRQGKLAMEDVLGQMAARTGGMASSFAEAAAQQTYDQYMADLANKVPELKQLAYSMYVDDYNRALGLYDRGYKRYSDDYDRYMDQTRLGYDIYNNDRNFAYNAYRDQVGDQQWQQQFGYNALRDAVGDQQWQQQFDWTRSTDARDYARNVLTGDRDYEANRADTQWSQNWQQTQFDYQKEQDAWNRQLAERQYQDSLKAELRDRVDRYGYMPTQQDAETYGLTALELASLQEQARHVRASDASKYYSGW